MVTDRKAERQRKGVRGGREERVRDVELEMDRRECGFGTGEERPLGMELKAQVLFRVFTMSSAHARTGCHSQSLGFIF